MAGALAKIRKRRRKATGKGGGVWAKRVPPPLWLSASRFRRFSPRPWPFGSFRPAKRTPTNSKKAP